LDIDADNKITRALRAERGAARAALWRKIHGVNRATGDKHNQKRRTALRN